MPILHPTKINASLFNLHRLVETLLDAGSHGHRWRADVEILPGYVSPYEGANKTPRCVVRHGAWFLRYSKGPVGSPLWDAYGDDFMNPEYALLALLHAPPPPSFGR